MADQDKHGGAGGEEARVRSILTSAHDAYISMDVEGRITEWNPAAERTFGWTSDQVLGKTVADTLIPPAMREAHWSGLRRFLETGGGPLLGRPVEVTALRRDGTEIPIEITITAMPNGERWDFHAFARDISGRHRRDRHRAAQQAVAETLAESVDAEQAMERVLPALCTTLGWEFGEFWVAHGPEGRFECRATWQAPGLELEEFERTTRELELGPDEGLVGYVQRSGRIAWLRDFGDEVDLPRAALARRQGVRGAVAVPLRRDGDVVGVIGLLSTEIRPEDPEVTEVLAAVALQAGEFIGRRLAEEEAERVKDEFFSLISHELRTPLTSILGYTELLVEAEGEELSDQARRFVEVIERNARRELRLVIDLLLLTRIEAGTFRVAIEAIDLAAIVREAAEVARPLAERAGITLEVEIGDVPVAAGDLERLGQVVDNLLSNAIKFTPRGGRVSLRLERVGERVVIEVADTGIGVPDAAVEHLFDRLFRTEEAERLQIQGTGLGLTIVKAIVDAHDGDIEVESAEGEGMVIRIALPLLSENGRSRALSRQSEDATR
jgi:PAS domain S-box-containing protein